MMIVTIVAALILVFSFIGGGIQGAVKSFFSLASFVIAIPIAGRFYPVFANLLSFLPEENWENFIGFFIVLALTSVVLAFVFYFPRKALDSIWNKGFFFRLFGGVLNLAVAAIGLTMFTLLISAYPVWDWLAQAMTDSAVTGWLVEHMGFVQGLLPEVMRG